MQTRVLGKESMEENAAAAEMILTSEELQAIRRLLDQITIAGERYDPNSENGQSVRR